VHLTIHRPLVQDAAATAARAGRAGPPGLPPPRPPRGRHRAAARAFAALLLARTARRLDGETARRAVA